MHWTDIVRRKMTLLTLGAWRVKTSLWGPHNKNLNCILVWAAQSIIKNLAQHFSIPTRWNSSHHFIIAPSGMLPLNTKLNTHEGRGKIRNSFLSKKIHEVTTQRAQIRPPWFRSDVWLTSLHQNLYSHSSNFSNLKPLQLEN